MRTIRLSLLASFGLNLLGAAAWWTMRSPQPAAVTVSLASLTSTATKAPPPAPIRPRAPLWVEADRKDLDALVARLRAAGCPPRELSAIVLANIKRQGEKLLFEGFASQPYWASRSVSADPKWRMAFAAEIAEQSKLVSRYLLTPELFAASDELVDHFRTNYGDFPVETLRRLAALEIEQSAQSMQRRADRMAQARPGESRTEDDPAAARAREQEQLAALRSILSPAEFEQYQLRNSPVAQSLRSRLDAFRPTEEEYKAIYAIEQAAREQTTSGDLTPEQRRALQQEKDERIIAALDPDRAADYHQLTEPGGGQLNWLMVRLDLPLATAGAVNTVRDETLAQANAVRADPQLTEAQRTEQLVALARQAASQLTATLGARGYAAYDELKGDWLRTLAPAGP